MNKKYRWIVRAGIVAVAVVVIGIALFWNFVYSKASANARAEASLLLVLYQLEADDQRLLDEHLDECHDRLFQETEKWLVVSDIPPMFVIYNFNVEDFTNQVQFELIGYAQKIGRDDLVETLLVKPPLM